MAQQQQLQGASGLSSAPVFAAGVESKRRQASDTSESVHKVARLRELQSRLSPVRSALFLQNSPLESRVEGMYVRGSSPLVASASVPSTSILPLPLPLPSHLFSVGEILIGSLCSSADSASIDAALSRAYTIDVGLESSDQPQGSSGGTLAAPASPREPPAEAADSEPLASGFIVILLLCAIAPLRKYV